MLPAVRELGIRFVGYSPLGRGFLTKHSVKSADEYASEDMRQVRDPRWQGENFAKNRAALSQLEALAAGKEHSASSPSPGSSPRATTSCIPGTRNAKRLAENVSAADVSLSTDDLRRIREAFPDGAYRPRYAEATLPAWV